MESTKQDSDTTADTTPDTTPDTTSDTSSDTSPGDPTSSWTDAERHPLDDEPRPVAEDSAPEAPPVRRRRGLGTGRHTTSVILSLLAVPAAYGALDYGFFRATRHFVVEAQDGRVPDSPALALAIAAACLLVAAGAGRISGLGPLLAGLVWGVGPAVWVYLDYASYVHRLDDVPELWDNTTFGLSGLGFAIFPAVAGLMLGAAVAGRWRRPPVTT